MCNISSHQTYLNSWFLPCRGFSQLQAGNIRQLHIERASVERAEQEQQFSALLLHLLWRDPEGRKRLARLQDEPESRSAPLRQLLPQRVPGCAAQQARWALTSLSVHDYYVVFNHMVLSIILGLIFCSHWMKEAFASLSILLCKKTPGFCNLPCYFCAVSLTGCHWTAINAPELHQYTAWCCMMLHGAMALLTLCLEKKIS